MYVSYQYGFLVETLNIEKFFFNIWRNISVARTNFLWKSSNKFFKKIVESVEIFNVISSTFFFLTWTSFENGPLLKNQPFHILSHWFKKFVFPTTRLGTLKWFVFISTRSRLILFSRDSDFSYFLKTHGIISSTMKSKLWIQVGEVTKSDWNKAGARTKVSLH